jgi:glycosyltransferase involved in cell wall biosynthesis
MRVVFFGLYTPLQGAPVIAEAANLLADLDVEFTMIGTGQELQVARAVASRNPRITWLNWVDGADLPSAVASHDVCLGIFGTTDKALRVVPNKVYQGAAAGCAVITSDTPPQRRALGSAGLLVQPGDANALADALRSLAADRSLLWNMRSAAYQHAVARFSPQVVTKQLFVALEKRGF